MSLTLCVYVGPYAEWLLTECVDGSEELVNILGFETGSRDELKINGSGYNGVPRVTRGRKEFWQLCCFAYFSSFSVSKPPRKLIWREGDDDGVLDLSKGSHPENRLV